eukprot:3875320-Lingulodinium_polyedra.AAC.1
MVLHVKVTKASPAWTSAATIAIASWTAPLSSSVFVLPEFSMASVGAKVVARGGVAAGEPSPGSFG